MQTVLVAVSRSAAKQLACSNTAHWLLVWLQVGVRHSIADAPGVEDLVQVSLFRQIYSRKLLVQVRSAKIWAEIGETGDGNGFTPRKLAKLALSSGQRGNTSAKRALPCNAMLSPAMNEMRGSNP